jgi:hypothetical protein
MNGRRAKGKANLAHLCASRTYGASLWCDAADVVAADGATVETWPARQGTAPTQSSAAKRASFNAKEGMLKFDGVDDAYLCALGLGAVSKASFIVFSDTTTAEQLTLEHTVQAYNGNGAGIYVDTGKYKATCGTNGTPTSRTGTIVMSPRAVVCAAMDRTTNPDTIASVGSYGFDDTTPSLTGSGTLTFATASAWIGARNNGAAFQFSKHIRAVFVVLGAMTQMEMAALIAAYRKVWWF